MPHTVNAAAHFMTYPKLEMSCGEKERDSGENVPFVGEKLKRRGNIYIPLSELVGVAVPMHFFS